MINSAYVASHVSVLGLPLWDVDRVVCQYEVEHEGYDPYLATGGVFKGPFSTSGPHVFRFGSPPTRPESCFRSSGDMIDTEHWKATS